MDKKQVVYQVLGSLFGNKSKFLAIHSSMNLCESDRWGVKVEIELLSGEKIIGRLSKKRRFNGKVVTVKGTEKKYKSYNCYY